MARLGLAKALEDVKNPTPVQLREAATQTRAYVALSPTLTAKEQEKFLAKAEKLDTQRKIKKAELEHTASQSSPLECFIFSMPWPYCLDKLFTEQNTC